MNASNMAKQQHVTKDLYWGISTCSPPNDLYWENSICDPPPAEHSAKIAY
jgi:hypothetical protein